jgi:hypothetical protein
LCHRRVDACELYEFLGARDGNPGQLSGIRVGNHSAVSVDEWRAVREAEEDAAADCARAAGNAQNKESGSDRIDGRPTHDGVGEALGIEPRGCLVSAVVASVGELNPLAVGSSPLVSGVDECHEKCRPEICNSDEPRTD